MNQRPKPGEDEDDLLRFQQQFLSSGSSSVAASVKVKRPEKRRSDEEKRDVVKMEGIEVGSPEAQPPTVPAKKSKFKTGQTHPMSSANVPQTQSDLQSDPQSDPQAPAAGAAMGGDEDIEDMMDRKDTGLAAVLTTIIERDTRNETCAFPVLGKSAFPQVLSLGNLKQHAESKSAPGGRVKKKSLFAQQIEKQGAQKFGVDPNRPRRSQTTGPAATSAHTGQQEPRSSCIVDGKGLTISDSNREAQRIHQENLDKLASLSERDILEEQQKLINTIDPKLVEFLKAKRGSNVPQEKPTAESAKKVSFSVQKQIRKQEKSVTDLDEPFGNIPIYPNKRWVHMDQVEKEKLEWMKDLPAPSSTQTGRQARFDFKGKLMSEDAEVPVNIGLHHHGDEPERAGYTMEELFQLARSSNLQQRCLALHTLARIIAKAKSGGYVGQTDTPIFPSILAGGVLLLLRWALDDAAEGVVVAAVDALHALVCCPQDQEGLSMTWAWHMGHTMAALTPISTLERLVQPEQLDEENTEEETDAEVSQRDLVLALVTRMELIPRLRYILTTLRPQAMTVVHVMALLTRVAQHSLTLAYEIVKCTSLVDLIANEFIPTVWETKVDGAGLVSDVYGLPVPQALRLFTTLCQAGRNIAASLVSKYQLHLRLLRYMAVPLGELQLPVQEASNLQMEALALWRGTAAYGLCLETYFDLYSKLLPEMGSLSSKWLTLGSVDGPKVKDQERLDVGLVCVLEQIANVAGSSLHSEGVHSQKVANSSLPTVHLSQVSAFMAPVNSCATDMMAELGSHYTAKRHCLDLPTACVNFLATFYESEGKQGGGDVMSRLVQLEEFSQNVVVPLLSSYGWTTILENLNSHSNIVNMEASPLLESSPSLPGLCGVVEANMSVEAMNEPEKQSKKCPILRDNSPFGFVTAALRLVLAMCKRHKSLINQLLPPLLTHADLLTYITKVCSTPSDTALGATHFTRLENSLHYFLLKCWMLVPTVSGSLPHRLGLRLMARLQHGDEHMAHDLMSQVVFSHKFISESGDIESSSEALAGMSLAETLYLRSATQEDIQVSRCQLLDGVIKGLNTIRGHYLMAFGGMQQAVQDSRNLFTGNSHHILSLTSKSVGETLMPKDWTYMPLIHVYNQSNQLKSHSGASMSAQAVAMVTSVLQWNFLLEAWRAGELGGVSVTIRVTRVLCTFLAGSDLFLEKPVHQYLAGLLRMFTTPRQLGKLDFEEKIPGMTAFYDLYQEVLGQYEAVSFGDPVFGVFLLLPLQQRHNSMLRKALWGERRKLLRTLRMPLKELLIPVENFLTPDETDIELLQLYLSALCARAVLPEWSPVLYLLAVHHINRWLYHLAALPDHKDAQSRMWTQLLANHDKVLDVVYYKQANLANTRGMELYEELPQSRQDTYTQRKQMMTTLSKS